MVLALNYYMLLMLIIRFFFNFPLKEKGMGEKKTYLFADFLELEIGHFGGCDSLSAFHLIFASYQVVI